MGMSLDSKEDIGISSKVEKFSDEVNMDLDDDKFLDSSSIRDLDELKVFVRR